MMLKTDTPNVEIRPTPEPRCDRSMISERVTALGIAVPPMRTMIESLRHTPSASVSAPA